MAKMCFNRYMEQTLRSIIEASSHIVFLGGAGVSTESGIPDFRSADGIYAARRQYGAPPETLLSHDFFFRCPEVFFDYYKKNLLYPAAQPNRAHLALAKLEQQGKLSAIITQNIDELHQRAGSRHVLELHGSVCRNTCLSCGKQYTMDRILASDGVPVCDCGGMIKPDVVLYGEGLDSDVLTEAVSEIRKADTLIIGGTSLVVYPAAGLVDYFRGKHLVVINLSDTHRDREATLCVHARIGDALSFILED